MVSFSVLIISHGRTDVLLKCLDSLRPPVSDWQLILVANGSPLKEEVLTLAKTLTPHVDVLELTEKVTPGKARNLGAEHIRHEWVFLLDEYAYLYPKYFEIASVPLMQERIDVLGGPELPAKGMGTTLKAFGVALGSPLCSGRTFARNAPKGRKLITATEEILTSSNLWIRSHHLKSLKFTEDVWLSEETCLLGELEKNGAHLFYHPYLKVARDQKRTLLSAFKGAFDSGYYRSRILKEKKIKRSEQYWVPSFFVLLHLILFFSPMVFWSFARMYAAIVVMMSLNICARRREIGLFAHVAIFHYLVVMLYGIGFLAQRCGYKRAL